MAAVRASGLVKRFESTRAIDGVDLVVQEGELRGLLGPNGAGKTTLLRLLFGLLTPDAGQVELLGRPLGAPETARLDGVAGFVEEPAFYPYLSGRVNLELLAELDRSPERAPGSRGLEQVGLAGAPGRGYSTGMRQRLGIAAPCCARRCCSTSRPAAGSGRGPRGGYALRRLAADGTRCCSSHLIGEIEAVCDSFTVLRRGRVVWNGSAAQLRDQAPGSAYRLHTSDDARAVELAARHPGLEVLPGADGELRLAVEAGALDPFVLELGRAGVAVRRLELLLSPLESMFFALTGEADAGSVALAELAEAALAGA